jgi:hypothetical protein
MLKKTGVILLLLLYVSTVPGLALNLHYCFNTLTSVSVDVPVKGCSLASAKMKCCKDKRIEIKIKDVHQSAASTILSKQFSLQLALVPFVNGPNLVQPVLYECSCYRGPPDRLVSGTPIFIKNCTLLI